MVSEKVEGLLNILMELSNSADEKIKHCVKDLILKPFYSCCCLFFVDI